MSGLPSTSEEAVPSRVTVAATKTLWSGPALAMGAEFSVVIVTVSGAESTEPSLTTSWTSYDPDTSAMNVGWSLVAPERVAVLPAGLETKDQA